MAIYEVTANEGVGSALPELPNPFNLPDPLNDEAWRGTLLADMVPMERRIVCEMYKRAYGIGTDAKVSAIIRAEGDLPSILQLDEIFTIADDLKAKIAELLVC